MPGSMKLGSMCLVPPEICLVTLAHPLAAHVLHSKIGDGVPATTPSASAAARRFVLLFPLLVAIGMGLAFLLVVLPCCLLVPCNLCLVVWFLVVRQ